MRSIFCVLFTCLALLGGAGRALAGGGLAAPGPASTVQKFVEGGIAFELAVEPLGGKGPLTSGEPARVRLAVSDTQTGAPLSGLYPGAWMDLSAPPLGPTSGAEAPAPGCREKIESFLGGSLLTRPEVDLNTYYVLALNDEPTISVVDPLFGFGNSQLLAMVFLKSPGEDWALTADGTRLFVSMPEVGRVAVVETDAWKVVTELDAGPRPRRLGLQPDGQYLWVIHDGHDGAAGGRPGVAVFDTRTLKKAADLPAGEGRHDLAFSADSRFAFATAEKAGTVSVYDAARLTRLREVATGKGPLSVAWSDAARAAYVVNSGDGTVAVVRPGGESGPAVTARLQAEPGLGALRFAPGGRLGFLLHPGKDLLHILDAASNRIVQTADVEDQPVEVAFSDELAYVRHRGSDTVLMVPLAVAGVEGRPVPLVDFPGGQHPPGESPKPSLAAGIVQAPGAPAVLVANPLDKAIYFYKEGMAAPMGHFQNYGRQPRAVLVVDRSLRETRPGTYETTVRLGRPGGYELALFLDAPRTTHCFPLAVAEDPAQAERDHPRVGVELLTRQEEVGVGEPVRLRVRLTDPASGAPKPGISDVRALTFLTPGIWQQRQWAEDLGGGEYQITFEPPQPGIYFVFLEAASAGLPFQKAPLLVLRARAREEKAAVQPSAGPGGGSQP